MRERALIKLLIFHATNLSELLFMRRKVICNSALIETGLKKNYFEKGHNFRTNIMVMAHL
jgi:hypothetical protein